MESRTPTTAERGDARRRPTISSSGGFTLTELAVALGISAIIISYAAISVRDAFAQSSLVAEGMSTRAIFVDCKIEALGRGVETKATVEAKDKRIDGSYGDSANDSAVFTVYRTLRLRKSTNIEKTTFTGRGRSNEVIFNPDSGIEGVNGAVYYESSGRRVRILLDAVSGTIKVQRYARGRWM